MKKQDGDGPKPKAIGYIRVSDKGGRAGPEYHTLDIQRASIEKVCEFRGYDLIDVYIEENKSGKDATRPKFRKAMSRILDDHEADALAVWKVSRFSRSWSQAAKDVEDLLERKPKPADLLSGEEGFDTATIGGKMLMRILFVVAAWEHDTLTEQWANLKERLIARGSHIGRNPVGYLRVSLRPDPAKPYQIDPDTAAGLLDDWAKSNDIAHNFEPVPGLLVPDPELAPLVLGAFQLRADGKSYADIQHWLDEVAPIGGGALWPHQNVIRMLTLRTYLGEVTNQGEELDYENPSAHLPIVPRDLFLEVETMEKGRTKRAKSEAEDFPLSGKIYCAACSWRMGGGVVPQVRKVWKATGEPLGPGRRSDKIDDSLIEDREVRYRVYRCPGRRGTGKCSAPSVISADALEAFVYKQVLPVLQASEAQVQPEDRTEELTTLDGYITEADAALMELGSLKKRRELGDDWGRMMGQLKREKQELVDERERLSPSANSGNAMAFDYKSLTDEERVERVRKLIGAVMVRKLARGAEVEERVRVLFQTDELPPLGSPTNRIPPTPYVLAA